MIPKAYVLALPEEEADPGRNAAVGSRTGEEGSASVVRNPYYKGFEHLNLADPLATPRCYNLRRPISDDNND
jgi:hypothetical protein